MFVQNEFIMFLPNVLHTSSPLSFVRSFLRGRIFSRYFLLFGSKLQFKRFLIEWEINNCDMFVSFYSTFSLALSCSFTADYSNYACDFTRLPKARCVCRQFQHVRILTYSNDQSFDSCERSFVRIQTVNGALFIANGEDCSCYLFY